MSVKKLKRAAGGRKCKKTGNITLRRVHENTVAVEKQYVLHISVCVCVWACPRARVRARACMPADACVGAWM